MESSEDGGDPAAATSAYIMMFAMVFLLACHKPSPNMRTVKKPALISANKASPLHAIKKKSKKKKLYLTFDDGPNRGTHNVLHIVEDENIPVSFFIVGEHVFASHEQSMEWDSLSITQHIALCNHSFTHASNKYKKFYQQPDSVVSDFQRSQDSLQFTNRIVRTPGRNIWRIDSLRFTDLKSSVAAADSLEKNGFMVMGWDVEWHFNPASMSVTSTANEMIEQIDSAFAKNRTMHPDHLVLLAHDQVYQKPDDSIQLRKFLQGLKLKDEYELTLVTSYPGVEGKHYRDSFAVNTFPR